MTKFIFLALCIIFPAAAYAYIDPGTGSLWLQYLIGGVASLYFLVKVYFGKIKAKLFRKKSIELPKNNEENKEVEHV